VGVLQLSYTRDMTSRTEYIASDALDDLRRQARQLQALQGMDRSMVDLSIEHSRLKMKLAREL